MQNRHLDRYTYFCELAKTSQDFYLSYLGMFISITPKINVLEIGCGEGGNLLPFAQKGCSVMGIDICYNRIEEAKSFFKKKNQLGTFICGDFLEEMIQGHFDIILIHDVIEHINPSQKRSFILKAKLLLKTNGIIFLAFLLGKCLLEDINKFVGIKSYRIFLSYICFQHIYTSTS